MSGFKINGDRPQSPVGRENIELEEANCYKAVVITNDARSERVDSLFSRTMSKFFGHSKFMSAICPINGALGLMNIGNGDL